MELFEQIRREYENGGGTIRGIARKFGIHRRMVREAVLSAVPADRKTPVRESLKLEPVRAFIEAILEADRKAPRKQRHTAHRIWSRIGAELPEVQVAECTIRRYVRKRKMELRLVGQEPVVEPSIAPFRMPVNRLFWKRTSGRSLILVAYLRSSVMTTSKVR